MHVLSIGRPHKEKILFLCNVKTCSGAEKLPRSSGPFVKETPGAAICLWHCAGRCCTAARLPVPSSGWCSAAGKSRPRKAVCLRFYNKYVSEIYIRCRKNIPEEIPIRFLYTWYIKAIRCGYFYGNISQNRKNAPAKAWIKQSELYRVYTFGCFNCALCTTVLFCRCNATG